MLGSEPIYIDFEIDLGNLSRCDPNTRPSESYDTYKGQYQDFPNAILLTGTSIIACTVLVLKYVIFKLLSMEKTLERLKCRLLLWIRIQQPKKEISGSITLSLWHQSSPRMMFLILYRMHKRNSISMNNLNGRLWYCTFLPVLRIRIRMFLGLLNPDLDPVVRSNDPYPSIIKQN